MVGTAAQNVSERTRTRWRYSLTLRASAYTFDHKMMTATETFAALPLIQQVALEDLAARPGCMTSIRWDDEDEQTALRYLEMRGFVTPESWDGYRQITRAGRDLVAVAA